MAEKSIPFPVASGKSFPPLTEQPVTLSTDGRVSSLALAEHFGIRHQHVLRDIRAVRAKVPPEWDLSNFGQISCPDEYGREQPAFLLTRDAFTLLAMGYNSPRAIQWKLRYIAAFNALESIAEQTLRQTALEAGAKLAYALTPSGKRRLNRAARLRGLGLGVASIAKLLDVDGREVSRLLKAAALLGKLRKEVPHAPLP